MRAIITEISSHTIQPDLTQVSLTMIVRGKMERWIKPIAIGMKTEIELREFKKSLRKSKKKR